MVTIADIEKKKQVLREEYKAAAPERQKTLRLMAQALDAAIRQINKKTKPIDKTK